MLKKWTERIVRGIIVLGLLLVLLDLGLHVISRMEWFKTRVTQTIQNSLGREIKLARMGANLRGIFIEDFAVAEQGGFENGTFVEAGNLRVRISLLHLLHGHTKIQLILLSNVTVKATVLEDGHTSWQDLIPAQPAATEEETAETGKFPFEITATHLRLEDVHLIYEDKTVPNIFEIEGLSVGVDHFRLDDKFSFYVKATVRPTIQGKAQEMPLVLHGKADLQKLDLAQAWVELEALSIAYGESSMLLKGKVENLKNPHLKLRAILRNLSAEGLKDIAALPPFELGKITLSLKGVANLEDSSFTLLAFTAEAPGAELKAQGGVVYAKKVEYDFSTEGEFRLGEIGRWFPLLAEPYRLMGTVKPQAQITHQQISGELQLAGVGGLVAQAGTFSEVDARVTFQEKTDFKQGAADMDLKGKLNGRPLIFHLQADHRPDLLNIVTHLQAQEMVLSPVVTQEEPPAPSAQTQTQPEETSSAWPLPPIRLQAKLEVNKLNVPYFYGEDLLFKADMSGIAAGFKQAHGSLHLSTGKGKIQDLYKLTNANPLTKVLFLSLDIVGKVFNSLNVLGVLNSLGSGIVSAVSGGEKEEAVVHTQTILGPDGEPIEVPVAQTEKNVEGEWVYDKFDTTVNFEHGVATVKKGSFVSPTASFRLDGKTDFNTQKVNLTVHAAPGRHEADGMMPLKLTIGGTIDNPQGDMALLGSITSLVTQSVTNNVVSRQIGKGIKGIVNLFKDSPEEQPEPADKPQTQETVPSETEPAPAE